jgi:hypothetical protein
MRPFGSPRGRSRPSIATRIAMLAAGFGALVPACARRQAAPNPATAHGAVQPVPSDSARSPVVAAQIARPAHQGLAAGQAPRMMVYGGPLPGVVVTQLPPEPEEQPEPKVAYPSVRIACDSVWTLTQRVLGVPVSRTDSTVDMDFGLGRRAGCLLNAGGNSAPMPPSEPPNPSSGTQEQLTSSGRLGDALQQAGWAYLPQYQADGCDGESQGYRSRESLCIVHWSWHGGDDSDSTYVPSDAWDLEVACARWEPGDSAR